MFEVTIQRVDIPSEVVYGRYFKFSFSAHVNRRVENPVVLLYYVGGPSPTIKSRCYYEPYHRWITNDIKIGECPAITAYAGYWDGCTTLEHPDTAHGWRDAQLLLPVKGRYVFRCEAGYNLHAGRFTKTDERTIYIDALTEEEVKARHVISLIASLTPVAFIGGVIACSEAGRWVG